MTHKWQSLVNGNKCTRCGMKMTWKRVKSARALGGWKHVELWQVRGPNGYGEKFEATKTPPCEPLAKGAHR